MKGRSPVLGRLVAVSAAVLGVGLVATACAPVEMGAAAIVGSQRITIATLDTEVTNLSRNVQQYHNPASLTAAQQTQTTLSWLIRFQINEQLARSHGISVSAAQVQTALAEVDSEGESALESEGLSNVTPDFILAYIGVPRNLSGELGRYEAIETQFIEQANGGKIPTTTAAQTALTAQLDRAQCVAAKTLQIQVNPQFGRLNYSQDDQVVSVAGTVSRAEGPAKAASTSGLTPAC